MIIFDPSFRPEEKALLVSDAEWIGNPVFMSSSMRDCIDSLGKIKTLTSAGTDKLSRACDLYS